MTGWNGFQDARSAAQGRQPGKAVHGAGRHVDDRRGLRRGDRAEHPAAVRPGRAGTGGADAAGAAPASPAVDLEVLFAREQPRPPETFESAFVEKAAPALSAVASVVQQPVAAQAPARTAARRRPVVPVPEPRPQAPLELTAMTGPAPAPPAAERPKLFGWSLPRLPLEDRITGTLSSARSTVARLFN
jgi:hypothetical protein